MMIRVIFQPCSKAFARFAEDTSLHGVQDFYKANIAGRVFWGTLAIVAVTGLCLQLQGVIVKYIDQETGVTLTEFTPERSPALYVCPDAWVDASKAAQHGVTGETVTAINGFLSWKGIEQVYDADIGLDEYIFQNPQKYGQEQEKAVALYQKMGHSMENLVDAIGYKSIPGMGATFPMFEILKQERVVTLSGVCYRFWGHSKLNSLQARTGGVKVSFNIFGGLVPEFVEAQGSYHFRVALADPEIIDLNAYSDVPFAYGSNYVLHYSVTSIYRVNTRKWPCNDYDQGDESHCGNKYGNRVAKGTDGCQSVLPRSTHFEEEQVDIPCNTFVSVMQSVQLKNANRSLTTQEWNEICPRPCRLLSYQYTYQKKKDSDPSNPTNRPDVPSAPTVVEVKAASGMSGIEIREFLVLDTGAMLANVGGTLGLWLGASVISIVQLFYLFCLQGCQKKEEPENSAQPRRDKKY